MAAAALLLAASACRKPQNTPLRIDPALETLVPADTVFLMGANLDRLRQTPVFQKYIGEFNLPRLNEFAKQTGVDPRKDIWQVLSVSNGKTGVLMARGKFSEGDLEPKLQANGAKRFSYKGSTLFGDENGASVAFVNSTTAIAGPTPAVENVLEQRGRTNGLPPALAERVRSLPANAQVWAVLIGGLRGLNLPVVPENSNFANALHVFQGLDSATMAFDLTNGLDMIGQAICNTDNDARHVHDALRGIIGLGRLSTPDNRPDLLKLYDAIHVEQNKNDVNVSAHIAPELVNNFIDLWIKSGPRVRRFGR